MIYLQQYYNTYISRYYCLWSGVCIHWTTGLTFELTFELFFFLSMINIAVVLLGKVNLGVLGK